MALNEARIVRMKVVLHVYDVTNGGSDKMSNAIRQINRIFKDRIGIGGIFHSAVQVYGDEEWYFGYCENGSGVFSCPPTQNPMYAYRKSIILGETNFTNYQVNQILGELRREWIGSKYDLLSRNCNHFCDAISRRLGVSKLPAWVNRFANAGEAVLEAAENTATQLRKAKTEIVSASKVVYRFLVGLTSNSSSATPKATGNTSSGSRISRFKAARFKNKFSAGVKRSSRPSGLPKSSSSDKELPVSQHKHLEYTHQSSLD